MVLPTPLPMKPVESIKHDGFQWYLPLWREADFGDEKGNHDKIQERSFPRLKHLHACPFRTFLCWELGVFQRIVEMGKWAEIYGYGICFLWSESSKNGKKNIELFSMFPNFEMKMKIKIETAKNYIIYQKKFEMTLLT